MIQTYYKVTNKDECHNGFKYKDGLNILTGKFDESTNKCGEGLYFTTKYKLHRFYSHGIYVREVYLPTENKDFKIVEDVKTGKYRANMIILGKKYDMSNVEDMCHILKTINGHIDSYIDWAFENGHIHILDWFEKMGFSFNHECIEFVIYNSSARGDCKILEWLYKRNVDFKYTSHAIDKAAENGNINVLDWFKSAKVIFDYTNDAIHGAIKNGHINVLKWFDSFGLELYYIDEAICLAIVHDKTEIIEWLTRLKIKMNNIKCNKLSKKSKLSDSTDSNEISDFDDFSDYDNDMHFNIIPKK